MTSIGIRELRQHASRYLKRVKAGETITVTDRGEPIAELRPIPPEPTIYKYGPVIDRLIAEGKIREAKGNLSEWLKENPPIAVERKPGEPTLGEILDEMREDIV